MSPSLLDKTLIDPMHHYLVRGFEAETSWSIQWVSFEKVRKQDRNILQTTTMNMLCSLKTQSTHCTFNLFDQFLEGEVLVSFQNEPVWWHQLLVLEGVECYRFSSFTTSLHADDKNVQSVLFPIQGMEAKKKFKTSLHLGIFLPILTRFRLHQRNVEAFISFIVRLR